MMAEALSGSLEDYLEAIFFIEQQKQAARAKDIAQRLQVNHSSVTGALRTLSQKGLINYSPYDLITLTTKGRNVAKDIARRHEVLRHFLEDVLDVPPELAEETACKMEHVVRGEVLERFVKFIEFIEVSSRAGAGWVQCFHKYYSREWDEEECKKCLAGEKGVKKSCQEGSTGDHG